MLALIAGCDEECTVEPARYHDPELPWAIDDYVYIVLSDATGRFGRAGATRDDDRAEAAYFQVDTLSPGPQRPITGWAINLAADRSLFDASGGLTVEIAQYNETTSLDPARGAAWVSIEQSERHEREYAPGGTVTIDVDFCDGWIEGHVDSYDKRFDATFVGPIEVDNDDGAFDWCDE